MKYLLILICLILISNCFALSNRQDNNNLAYLDELDVKIINTIDLISAFNETMQNLVYEVQNADEFSHYLMDLVIECSSIRKLIEESRDLDPLEREFAIPLLYDSIKPPYPVKRNNIVMPSADEKNRVKLNEMFITYQDKLNKLRGAIINEEKIIIKNGALSQRFVSLHNRHFIYHLILDFISDHQYLSAQNRQYLIDIIAAVEKGIADSVK